MISKSTVKYIQSLQHKKFRDETNCFVAEGPKVVGELLESGLFAFKHVFAVKEWIDEMSLIMQKNIKDQLVPVEIFELEKISGLSTPHLVLAVFEQLKPNHDFSIQQQCTLVLEDIQDPGNMGTIIRSADWFGVKNIVCSQASVDIYNPKVVQSTMASLGRVNVIYTDLHQWISNHQGVPVFAATLEGQNPAILKDQPECMLVIGNESKGISADIKNLCTGAVSIPKTGKAESLNAAIATAILLYARQ